MKFLTSFTISSHTDGMVYCRTDSNAKDCATTMMEANPNASREFYQTSIKMVIDKVIVSGKPETRRILSNIVLTILPE